MNIYKKGRKDIGDLNWHYQNCKFEKNKSTWGLSFTKEEVKDYLVSIRHRLNIVQKRLQPRLERIQKARMALDEAISKIDELSVFSKEEVQKIIEEIRETYKDVWDHHPM